MDRPPTAVRVKLIQTGRFRFSFQLTKRALNRGLERHNHRIAGAPRLLPDSVAILIGLNSVVCA